MAVETHLVSVHTRGETAVVDLTSQLGSVLGSGKVRNGTMTVFVQGSTCAVTTLDFEPGLANEDVKAAYDRMVPDSGYYQHNFNRDADNGHAHVRATVTGPSITVPLVDGAPTLADTQQIVMIDFDTRPRKRDIFVQIIGE